VRSPVPLALVGFTLVILAGCAESSQAESSVSSDAETSTVAPASVLELEVGMCLMDLSTPLRADMTEVPEVDCVDPHESEVFAEVPLEGTVFPGIDLITRTAVEGCTEEFLDYVGVEHAASLLDFSYYYPTESSWAVGDRSVFCVVYDPGALTEGTLRDSRR
jgi:hypothetical protein